MPHTALEDHHSHARHGRIINLFGITKRQDRHKATYSTKSESRRSRWQHPACRVPEECGLALIGVQLLRTHCWSAHAACLNHKCPFGYCSHAYHPDDSAPAVAVQESSLLSRQPMSGSTQPLAAQHRKCFPSLTATTDVRGS